MPLLARVSQVALSAGEDEIDTITNTNSNTTNEGGDDKAPSPLAAEA